LAALAMAAASPLALGQAAPAAGSLDKLVDSYCAGCHNAEDWAGSLAFDTLDLAHVAQEPEVWEKTIGKLRGRLMPPAGQKQPAQGDVDAVVRFLETSIDSAAGHKHVGHVPVQRLSRDEFAASIRSLIGVEINARQALPTEIEVEGFSNIAEALAMSPAFLEQYMSATRRAVRLAVGEPVPKMAKVFVAASAGKPISYPLGTRATAGSGRGAGMSFSHIFPADGEYRFNVTEEDNIDIGLYPRGAENPATMVIFVDGVEVARKEIGGGEWLDIADRDGGAGKKKILEMVSTPAKVRAGKREVAITFIERSAALSNNGAAGGGFGGGGGRIAGMPIIQTGIEIEGPFQPTGISMNPSRAKIFVCEPKKQSEERACAEKIARHMATQAFRRPVTDADLAFLMKFYEMGRAEPGAFDAGITEMVTAVLSSPDFLYRAIPAPAVAGQTRLLTDLELATRLSFFLWNTGPDKELLDLAAAGKVKDPATLNAQVARMLKDPRADSLVENFALAWLNLDELEKVEPMAQGWNAGMRTNFETEIRMFLASVLLEERSVVDLLTADWTFVNQDLARHYGISGVRGPLFRRVQLTNPNRFGLLGKGAVLLRTSYADRTSPVLRGSWILERVMGTPPTPPPPGVETNLSVPEGQAPTTVRARLEAHRENPTCQGCHGLIDPPGLALENFDNTGAWRDTDTAARAPIDASTVLSSGAKLNGPVDLRNYLLSREDQFPTTVTTRLMMFALNREVEHLDMPEVRRIVREAKAKNYTLNALIEGIVNSDAFRRQGAEKDHKQAVASATAMVRGNTAPRHP
jgi:hypothetical protein